MFKVHLKRILFFTALGLIGGTIYFFVAPKVYEGRSQVLVANDSRRLDPYMPEEVVAILSMGLTQSVETEAAILGGENVFYTSLLDYASETGKTHLDPRQMNQEQFMNHYRMSSVFNPDRTRVCEVRVRAYDPQEAADLTNKLVETYNDARLRTAQESVQQAKDYLERQSTSAKVDIDRLDQEVKDFKQQNGVTDWITKNQELIRYQSALIQEIGTKETELRQARANLDQVLLQLKTTPPRSPHIVSDDTANQVASVEARLTEARATLQAQLETYLPDSPIVRAQQAVVNTMEQRLSSLRKEGSKTRTEQPNPVFEQLRQSKSGLMVQISGLESAISERKAKLSEQDAKLMALPEVERKLVQLSRDREVTDTNYRKLKSLLEDLNNRTNAGVRAAQILFTAQTDQEPVAPEFWIVMLIGGLAGITLGLLFSFTKESMRPKIYDPVQLGDVTGLPVLPGGAIQPLAGAVKALQEKPHQFGRSTERFRFLAIQIAKGLTDPNKAIMFSGVGRRAGCSYSAFQVARALASSGSRTLLIDGDLRRRSLTQAFGLEGKAGLSDVVGKGALPAEAGSMEALHKTSLETLQFMPAGAGSDLPVASFSREDLGTLLRKLNETYEHIVIDTPAADMIADAAHVAPLVDEVVLLVNEKNGDQLRVLNACKILESAGAKSIHVSMTGVKAGEDLAA